MTTQRLELHPLPLTVLDALIEGDLPRVREQVAFDLDEQTFAGDGYVLRLRQAQLRADPSELPWLYRAAVLRGTREVVGRIGLHAPPDDRGSVEIGYSVQPARRRQGLATEMAAGLLDWARERGATECVASTAPGNLASQAVLARLGFVRTGEAMDDVDGLEWVFTLALNSPVAVR